MMVFICMGGVNDLAYGFVQLVLAFLGCVLIS